MRLERVVQDRLCPVRPLDDDVGLREAPLCVAAGERARLGKQLPSAHRLLRIEQRLEHLVLDVDQRARRAGLPERVGGHGGDGLALEVGLAHQLRDRLGLQHGVDTRRLERARRVEPRYARARVRRTQHGGLEHSRQLQVRGVERLARRALDAVLPRGVAADDVARAVRPRVERVLLDDEPDFLEAAFDFLLGADQSCHVRIASSILG